MESATDRPDFEALQQEVDFARRYQQFLRDNASYHSHIVINPLTYVNGYAEILEQVLEPGEVRPQLLEFFQAMKYGAIRAIDAFHFVMHTIQLPLVEPADPTTLTLPEPSEEAAAIDPELKPAVEPADYSEQLHYLNTALLNLFHTWRLDPTEHSLSIEKCENRRELRLTIQLFETKADLAQAKMKTEPAALTLANAGGTLQVEKIEGSEITFKLMLPHYFTN